MLPNERFVTSSILPDLTLLFLPGHHLRHWQELIFVAAIMSEAEIWTRCLWGSGKGNANVVPATLPCYYQRGGSRQCVPLIEKASLNMYQSLAWLRMWNSTVTFIQRWAEAWLKCQLWQEGILSLSARAWAAHLNALFWKLLGRVFQKKAFKVYTSIFRNLLNLDKICSCFLNGGHRPLLVLLSFWSSLETTHPMLHQPLCGQYMRVLVHLFLSIGLALKLHF